jgi:hypothetical protein
MGRSQVGKRVGQVSLFRHRAHHAHQHHDKFTKSQHCESQCWPPLRQHHVQVREDRHHDLRGAGEEVGVAHVSPGIAVDSVRGYEAKSLRYP